MAKANTLRNSEKRTKRQQKLTPVDVAKTKEYVQLLATIKSLEIKKEKIENQIQKKLEPVKITLGISKLEDKIFDIDDQIDELWETKERFEHLVIQELSTGKQIADFILRIVSKRFSVAYKAICEEIFKGRSHEFQEAKERYGSRKEQYVLIHKGEEVAKQLII